MIEWKVPMPLAPKPESVASDVDFIRKWLQDPRYKKIHPVLSSLLEQVRFPFIRKTKHNVAGTDWD